MTTETTSDAWVRFVLLGEVSPLSEDDPDDVVALCQGAETVLVPDVYQSLLLALSSGASLGELAEIGGTVEVLSSLVEAGVCVDLGDLGGPIPSSDVWVSLPGGFLADTQEPSLGKVPVSVGDEVELLSFPVHALAILSATGPSRSLPDVTTLAAETYGVDVGVVADLVRVTLIALIAVDAATVVRGDLP